MGKNVLESPGVVLKNPSTLLPLLLLLTPLLGLMAANPPHRPLPPGATSAPRKPQWNISQTEYETKHREYFDLVEQNQRRRLSPSSYAEENIVRKKLFTFTHSGLRNSEAAGSGVVEVRYSADIPEERGGRWEVGEVSVRVLMVPRGCGGRARVEVEGGRGGGVVGEAEVEVEGGRGRWVGVGVREGVGLGGLGVRVGWRGCGVGVAEAYLNVVVEVRGRGRRRRRRAERKRRRRFPGRCVRHPWEVELGKLKGYEYIVQPRKFDAGLCAGKCTGQWNLATQHSNLQYLFSNIDKSIPKPCCAPSKMESLEILYLDEDNPNKLKVSVWNDTKVVECACS